MKLVRMCCIHLKDGETEAYRVNVNPGVYPAKVCVPSSQGI